jgi:hypothetical protein
VELHSARRKPATFWKRAVLLIQTTAGSGGFFYGSSRLRAEKKSDLKKILYLSTGSGRSVKTHVKGFGHEISKDFHPDPFKLKNEVLNQSKVYMSKLGLTVTNA